MRKYFVALMALVMSLQLALPAMAAEEPKSEDTVILYTNDVHSNIHKELSYDVLAALKDELETQYEHVLLVDAGDHVQGMAYGSMDKGETIIKLMNAAGYDVATLGNHEFDYGMDGCQNVIEWAEYPYISSNFHRLEDGVRGENVLDSYKLFDCGDQKIALVGITTPETFSSSARAYFQDGNGSFIYGISGVDDAADFHADVQNAIDAAVADGATVVIALGHLGIDLSSQPYTSRETIAGVSGLDAFIDGHSHHEIPGELVSDKDGEDVVLTQTGEYFQNIGKMVIDAETGAITTELLDTGDLVDLTPDADTKAIKDVWMTEIDGRLGEKIGTLNITLDNYDETGKRLVRSRETNTGNFCADALYYLFDSMDLDVDVAVTNGGGIRNTAITGDLTYLTCRNIHPFGNVACLLRVTGQQLLDALEWGVHQVGSGAEDGGFLQVSGVKFDVDATIPSTVRISNGDMWAGSPTGEYRVRNVTIYDRETDEWEELDLDASYNLAGYNYILRNLGNGYTMFDGAVNVQDYVMEDYMVLANYIEGFDGGVVSAGNSPITAAHPGFEIDYGDVLGDGRIAFPLIPYKLTVGGVQVTEENMNDVLGDGTVTYDPGEKVLTLTNADIAVIEGNYGIDSGTDLTVELVGENRLSCTGYYGLLGRKDLTICGEGTLDVAGSDFGIEALAALTVCESACVNASGGDVASGRSFGIRGADTITVSGNAVVTAVGGKAPATSYGIYAGADFIVCDDAKVSAAGGKGTESSIGIYIYDPFTIEDNAAVTARADESEGRSCGTYPLESLYVQDHAVLDTAGSKAGNDSYGMRTTDIFIDGGKLIAKAGEGVYQSTGIFTQGMEVEGGVVTVESQTATSGPSTGLHVSKVLSVTGRDTVITATGADASTDASCGIYVGGAMTVEQGTVTALSGCAGYTHGIEADEVLVSGGRVTAQAAPATGEDSYSWGIQAYNALTVSGGAVTARGGEADGYSYGAQTTGKAQITGGELTSTASAANKSFGLWAFDAIEMNGGKVNLSAENGKAIHSYTELKLGGKMAVKTPSGGYVTGDEENPWTVVNRKGEVADTVKLGKPASGGSSSGGSSKPEPKPEPEESFSDLDSDAWYSEAVNYALKNGLMAGVGEGKFEPLGQTCRAMFVTALWSHAGKPVVDSELTFPDVPADSWYADAVRWAASKGITAGYADGSFGPADPVTREQLAAMLYRYEQTRGGGFKGMWMFLLRYEDTARISDWAYEPLCWMTMKGVISGKPGNLLDPTGYATRAEMAQMLMKYLEGLTPV